MSCTDLTLREQHTMRPGLQPGDSDGGIACCLHRQHSPISYVRRIHPHRSPTPYALISAINLHRARTRRIRDNIERRYILRTTLTLVGDGEPRPSVVFSVPTTGPGVVTRLAVPPALRPAARPRPECRTTGCQRSASSWRRPHPSRSGTVPCRRHRARPGWR